MAKSKNDRNSNFSDNLSNATVANHGQSDRFTSNDIVVNEHRSPRLDNVNQSGYNLINSIEERLNHNLNNAVIVDMATGKLTSVIIHDKK